MKKLAFLFITLVAIITMSACRIEKTAADTPVKSFTLNLSGFQSIKNYSNCDIHFTQSPTYSVVLKATQHWYDTHTVAVRYGELVITEKEERKEPGITVLHINGRHDSDANLWISAPTLTASTIAGSGDFYAETPITGHNLELSVAGSGDTELKTVTLDGNFRYSVAGSGDISTGTLSATNATFDISGSGDVDSKLAKVGTTRLSIAGSGDADLDFTDCDQATVAVSGSGDITLSGNLRSLEKRISGSGDIDTDKLRIKQ